MKKLVTFYSDSHSDLYFKYFLPSVEIHASEFKLCTKKIEQISPTGVWASKNFNIVMLEKIRWIIDNIDASEDQNFLVYADCDVQFFNRIDTEDLLDFDIKFQKDYYEDNVCAGFFICRQNEKVKSFFRDVEFELHKQISGGSNIDDQEVINRFLRKNSDYKPEFRFGLLPPDKYWTVANSTQGNIWTGQSFFCPDNIVMHHANFTIGLDNKMKLLDSVRQTVFSQNRN